MSLPTDQQKEIAELYAEGVGRNEIARRVGVTTYRVDTTVRLAGGAFDSSQTSAATMARRMRAEAHRESLAERFRDAADSLLNIAEDETRDTRERREAMTAAGIAVDKDKAITGYKTALEYTEQQQEQGWVQDLMDYLR